MLIVKSLDVPLDYRYNSAQVSRKWIFPLIKKHDCCGAHSGMLDPAGRQHLRERHSRQQRPLQSVPSPGQPRADSSRREPNLERYNEERENKYSMDVNVPYSVDTPYSTLCREDEAQEIWMSPLVDKLMLIYLTGGDFSDTRFRQSPSSIPENEELDVINPRLYTVDNSQHFELEMKIMATRDIWTRELMTIKDCYPMVFNQAYPILKPFSGYVVDNVAAFNPRPRYSPLHSSYPVYDVNHFSPYKSNMSSSGSSTCSSTSPLHPIYQQQPSSTPKHTRRHLSSPASTPCSIKDFNLETADLSKFLLFTLDLESKEDCMKQTIDLANTWLNQVYPGKQAQKLERKTVGPRKSLFASPEGVAELCTPVSVVPPIISPPARLPPTQVKSTPFVSGPVKTTSAGIQGETLTELVKGTLAVPRPLSLPLSFSAVTKGACSKNTIEQSAHKSGEKKVSTDKTLACTTRKSRSKHRPPHPTDPSRPSGVYTTLSGYKYFSPPRPRGSSEDEQV
ncbi:hypothetical protein M8J75_011387 [Diaphorina citri]|nr:hypothetical protein M8J75_011387 [Diaphorina citri]